MKCRSWGRASGHIGSVQSDPISSPFLPSDGAFGIRREDIPFIAERGKVLIATSTAILRALPKATVRMRLLSVDDHGERMIGDYTFNHTPYAELGPA